MSRAERKRRYRAKNSASWKAKCTELGPQWAKAGGMPMTAEDIERVTMRPEDFLQTIAEPAEPKAAK